MGKDLDSYRSVHLLSETKRMPELVLDLPPAPHPPVGKDPFPLTFLVIGHQGFGDGLADCCEENIQKRVLLVS